MFCILFFITFAKINNTMPNFIDTVFFGIAGVISLLLCLFAWITIRDVLLCNLQQFISYHNPLIAWRQSIWRLCKTNLGVRTPMPFRCLVGMGCN